ncbi:hypothetical protein ACFPID_06325 [Bifidobacterium leontopitheci]
MAAVVVLAGSLTTWRVVEHNHLTAARSACESSQTALSKARKAYATVVASGDVTEAAKVTSKQVEDAKTLTAFQKTLDAKPKASGASDCSASKRADLDAASAGLRESADSYTSAAKDLKAQAKAVLASRDAKLLTDARKHLSDKAASARKLLDSSNGKVKDNATRVRLTQRIQEADKLNTSTDVKALDAKGKELDAAVKAVNDSIAAKRKADAEAKKKAEAAAKAAQAQRSSSGSTSRRYSYSGSGYSYSGGGSKGYSGSRGSGSSSTGSSSSGGGSNDTPQSHSYGCGQDCGKYPSMPHTGCKPNEACPIG